MNRAVVKSVSRLNTLIARLNAIAEHRNRLASSGLVQEASILSAKHAELEAEKNQLERELYVG